MKMVSSKIESLQDNQKEAFERLVNGESLFITGNAGTGKSYLVDAFDEYCTREGIRLVKCAPTGVAANEIGGATIHSQFGFSIGIDEMLKKVERISSKQKFLMHTDVLLIDEISMVRIDLFDRLMQLIFIANKERNKNGLKDIQLIFVGDFFQLAPVISKEDKTYLTKYYKRDVENGYCFQSKYWKMFNIKMINLEQVIRQKDEEFCSALDKCKFGDSDCLTYLRDHFAKEEQEGAIWVVGKNATADEKNKSELAKVEGESIFSYAKYHGDVTKADKLCDDFFEYKIGAKVVILVNDTTDMEYQNGTIATVVGDTYKENNSGVLVPAIELRLANGHTVEIEKKKFSKYQYEIVEKAYEVTDEEGNVSYTTRKELKKKEVGYAEQYPLRLGYAVTVHKSQGQTYDAMNFVPEIFSDGQLYVALSRCKSVDKIYVFGYINSGMVRTAKAVKDFYGAPEEYSFFGEAEEMCQINIPKKYEGRIKQLIAEWQEEDGMQFGFENEEVKKEVGKKTSFSYKPAAKTAPVKRAVGEIIF